MKSADRRTVAVVAASLCLAAILCRGFVADALVSRGDEFLRAGELAAARIYFGRAIWFDGGSESAVERFTFVSLQLRDRSALRAAIDVAGAYLIRRPRSISIRVDRALSLYVAGRSREAVPELLRAAKATGDFRLYALAAHAASKAREQGVARAAYRSALALNPAYRSARVALRLR